MLSQYVVILGQEYWKTAKITPPIIIKLLLGHLSILIIEKELLGNRAITRHGDSPIVS